MEALKEIINEDDVNQINQDNFHVIFYSMRFNMEKIRESYMDLIDSVANASCEHERAGECFFSAKIWRDCRENLIQAGKYQEEACNRTKSRIREKLDFMKSQTEELLKRIEKMRNSSELEDCCYDKQGFGPYECQIIPF